MKNIAVKYYLVLGVSILLAIIIAGCTQLSEAEQLNNVGAGLYEQGHLEEAIAEYDEAIHLNPQFALAYTNRSAAYDGLGEYPRAIKDLDEPIRLDPKLLRPTSTEVSSTFTSVSTSGLSRT